jgi:hypothetical protein
MGYFTGADAFAMLRPLSEKPRPKCIGKQISFVVDKALQEPRYESRQSMRHQSCRQIM